MTADEASSADARTQLEQLALDLRWSWNHAADELWRQLDPELWSLTHNPWAILQTVSRKRVDQLISDPDFTLKLDALVQARRDSLDQPAWFQRNHAGAPLTRVAYFSMEFMLAEALSPANQPLDTTRSS